MILLSRKALTPDHEDAQLVCEETSSLAQLLPDFSPARYGRSRFVILRSFERRSGFTLSHASPMDQALCMLLQMEIDLRSNLMERSPAAAAISSISSCRSDHVRVLSWNHWILIDFLKFHRRHSLQEISSTVRAIISHPTSPQTRRYTTLWNANVRKLGALIQWNLHAKQNTSVGLELAA